LIKRSDSCYLLTAGHVVGKATQAEVIGAGNKPQYGIAMLVALFPNYDLALLRVTGAVTSDCTADISELSRSIDDVVKRQESGVLSSVYDDGSMGRTQVEGVDTGPEFIRFAPRRQSESIAQGQSGSLVKIAERPAGILLSVEGGGIGKALRFDFVTKLLEEFFRNPSIGVVPDSRKVALGSPITARAGNLLSGPDGAKLVSWNTSPARPDSNVNQLLDALAVDPWLGKMLKGSPIYLDFLLNGERVHVVSRVELMQAATEPPARRIKDYEVFFSNDGVSWRSLYSGTLLHSEELKVIQFPPVRASRLRLAIRSNWGDPESVALKGIAAF
jgi:hypothetical protein